MDCARVRSLLHPWLDGELDRDDHRGVLEHLGVCEQCEARFKDEQRLLGRVKQGLATPCPAEVRARLLANLAATPVRQAPRTSIVSFRFAAAAAAVLVVSVVWSDPICFRGCPTVRALALDHQAATPAVVTTSLELAARAAQNYVGEPVPECAEVCDCSCTGLECLGVKPIACTKEGCMILFKDHNGRAISFVKMKRGHVHPWLRFRASPDGLIATKQDGCRFVGWDENDGGMCGLVADENVDQGELVALSEKVRGH